MTKRRHYADGTSDATPESDPKNWQTGQYGSRIYINPNLSPGEKGQRVRDAANALEKKYPSYHSGTCRVKGRDSR